MKTLIDQISFKFEYMQKPDRLYSLEPFVNAPDNYRLKLQKEFEAYDKSNLPSDKCSLMLFENVLISDDAILYFLPRLFAYIINEEGNEFFLYSRLEKMNSSSLKNELKTFLDKLILFLKTKEELESD